MNTTTAEKIFRAYRTGLLKKEAGAAKPEPSFQSLLSQIVLNRFSLAERLAIHKLWQVSWRGLCAAREDCLADAETLLAAGRSDLLAMRGSPDCRFLALSALESAHAYLVYRMGRFDEARQRVLAAMDADALLERDEAYALLELHRIQGANNLMRIDLRAGAYARAVALAGALIAYLEGCADALPVHHSWRPHTLRQNPRTIRRGLVAQVAGEGAIALRTSAAEAGWTAFYGDLGPYLHQKQAFLHPRVKQWIEIGDAFEREDWERYLGGLLEFLPDGPADIAPLWYSSLIDLLDFCQRLNCRLGRHMSEGILRDSLKWRTFPSVFQPCLSQRRQRAEP